MEEPRTLHVSASLEGEGYTTRVTGPSGELICDEPDDAGNINHPMPTELLLASLASCMAITVQMYAQRKRWPLRSVRVDARGIRTPDGHHFTRFETGVHVDGELDESQRDRLLVIAQKCPVHRTIEAGPTITTTLA